MGLVCPASDLVLSRLFDDALGVGGKEEPFLDQALGRLSNALHIALVIRIPFLDREAVVPRDPPLLFRLRERNVRAGEATDRVLGEAGPSEVPPRMGGGRHLQERVPDAGDVVAVFVLRSHEDGIGRALRWGQRAVIE